MNKRSHLFVTGKIAEQIPEKGRNWFLLGSILPDFLYHTYWKGHMFESSFDSISKKMCELEKHGRDNRFSYLILGYILHYVEDFYTLAHNPVFEGSLPSHILYEKQLEEYLKEEDRFPENENDSVMSLDATLQYLRDEHKEYLKEAGNFETDAKKQETEPETSVTENKQVTEIVFTEEERKRIDEIKNSIDFLDTQNTVQYGIGAQRKLTEFTDSILATVKSKDGGEVGELLSNLAIEIKGLDVDKLAGDGILEKLPVLKNAVNSVKKLKERYTKAEVQIDRIEAALEKSRMEMLKDIGVFDIMYQENLNCFRELEIYIQAGKERVEEIKRDTIPALQAEAVASGNPMDAQLVKDFQDTVDRFEKKIYDLELSRTISIQSAPQIKLIQNNDRVLVDKIQTAILNTIPIWKSQFVIAMGLSNQQRVLKMQQEITNTTNAMLVKNAELLKTNTIETAKESNRGIVDIETLTKVNENLLSTIEETIQIQKEGRQKRQAAEEELGRIETELKNKLIEIQ